MTLHAKQPDAAKVKAQVRGGISCTVAELVALLDPPMTAAQIRGLICAARLRPVAVRHHGPQGGRPARAYLLEQVLDAHARLRPLLLDSPPVD